MKIFIFLSVLSLALINPINRIAEINKAKKAAREAVHQGDYETAIKHYHFLTDSMGLKEDKTFLNLGNAYFQKGDSLSALQAYQQANSYTRDNEIKSNALTQMGVIAHKMQQMEEALNYFKQALRQNPHNEEARYNYELLKKLIQEQENQENQDGQDGENNEENDQENGDQDEKQKPDNEEGDGDSENENSDQQEGEGENEQDKEQQEGEGEGEEGNENQQDQQQQEEDTGDKEDETKIPPSTAEKLKEMNMSEEKAQMILEAMRNAEAQYLQQLKKKPTKKADPNMPDW